MALQTVQEAYDHDNAPFTLFRSGGREFHGFYADIRIDRKTLPEGWHAYDIRAGEGNEPFGQLKNGTILADHIGTFYLQGDIGLPEGRSLWYHVDEAGDGVELMDDEWDYEFDEEE